MKNKPLTFTSILVGIFIFTMGVAFCTFFPDGIIGKPAEEKAHHKHEKATNNYSEQYLRAYQVSIIDTTLVLYDRDRYVGEVSLSPTENATLNKLIEIDNE